MYFSFTLKMVKLKQKFKLIIFKLKPLNITIKCLNKAELIMKIRSMISGIKLNILRMVEKSNSYQKKVS